MKLYKGYLTDFSQEEYDKFFQMMSQERKDAILRKKFESHRRASVLGEALARKGISQMTGIAQEEISFGRTENGKPFCENVDIHFSISHSKDMVICAVSNSRIGVDVEFIREIDFRITKFACNERDMLLLDSQKEEKERTELFFKIWTAKEAYIKYHGKILADIRDAVYEEIKKNCEFSIENGYMISVYE